MTEKIFSSEGKVEDKVFPLFGDPVNYPLKRPDEAIQDAVFFHLNQPSLSKLVEEKNYKLQLDIPVKGRKKGLKVNLQRKNIFGPDFKVRVASNPEEDLLYEKGLFYQGSIEGTKDMNAVFSIFNNEIFGWIITPEGNYTIGKMKDASDVYTCYLDDQAQKMEMPTCSTEDDGHVYSFGELKLKSRGVGDCVKVYFEVDNSVVTSQGSVANAIAFVTNAFAQVALIYDAEDILMVISEMFVWDVVDPFTGPSSRAYLTQFQNTRTNINGADLGHLVAMVNNGGVAAGFDAICNPEVANRLCYSGMSGANQEYPTFSFNAFILAHEMGHLVGSRHTHACVWNGNGTAIDGCSNSTEGSCPLPPNPIDGGTIMSYCSNTAVGVNFNEGFGPQPGDVIRNTIAGADCLTTDCSPCDVEIVSVAMTPNTECDHGPNGSMKVVATSSSGPFEYSISGPVMLTNMTGVFDNLPGGIYTVSVSDLGTNGCTTLTYQSVNTASSDVPVNIPTIGTITSELSISSSEPITGIKVIGLRIQHSFVGDLSATLTSPEGTVVSLFNRPGVPASSFGCDWRNMFVSFGDDAALSASNLEATCEFKSFAIFGEYQSIDPLNVLIGENPMGTWTLTINDAASPDGGMLIDWGLDLCKECTDPVVVNCTPHNIQFNGESTIPLDFSDVATASSGCGIASTTVNPETIGCEDIGSVVNVTATATDINGNSNFCVSQVTVTGLPCGWTQSPDGINCTGGSNATYNAATDQFILQANNCYYGSPYTSQSLASISQQLCGNGVITAQVLNVSGLGYAGISIRESNDPGSKMVSLMTNLQSFLRREARVVTNGTAFPQQFPSLNRFWLRLERQGNGITGYVSRNGFAWNFVMHVNVTMGTCVQVGLVATNGNTSTDFSATFGNVDVSQPLFSQESFDGFAIESEYNPEILSMYPNPGSDIISLKWADVPVSGWEILVTDAVGKIVQFDNGNVISGDYHELDMSRVSPGIYFVKCFSDSHGEIVKRLVIQR